MQSVGSFEGWGVSLKRPVLEYIWFSASGESITCPELESLSSISRWGQCPNAWFCNLSRHSSGGVSIKGPRWNPSRFGSVGSFPYTPRASMCLV